MAEYLKMYAARFNLPIRLKTHISEVERNGSAFVVRTDAEELAASAVIVATGAYHRPFVPPFASGLSPEISQIHSSRYRNPEQLPDGDALVVGAGNSGAQIALELAASRRVWLSGRDTGAIPRRVLGRDVYDWLWPTLMRPTVDSWLGRRLMEGRLFAGDPLVGLTARDLVRPTLKRVGRTTGERDGRPVLEGGQALEGVSSIIWCTGFRPDFSWIRLPIFDENAYPRHRRGLATGVPGLAFLGLRYQYRLGSSLLGGVGEDAGFVVSSVMNARRRAA